MRGSLARSGLAVAVATLIASVLIGVVPAGAAAGSPGAGAPGVTGSSVKVGVISDLTGAGASTFADSVDSMEARFKQVNAQGGVDGRKITWAVGDTESSPTSAETAAKDLVQSKGVFLVASVSALLFGGAPFLQQAGVPVLGYAVDGPEWFTQPYTNMFSFSGSGAAQGPAYTDGGFWKSIGATKISFIASNTPSSTGGIGPFEAAMKAEGLAVCDDTVVPLGGVNFTTYALSFTSAGCDAAECSCVLSSGLAVSTALAQDGVVGNKVLYGAGPSDQVYANSADLAAAKGAYFEGTTYSNAAGKAFLAGLKKYDPEYKGGLPDLGSVSGWETGNEVVEALEVAGKSPTRASLMAGMRTVSNWTDDGLATSPVSWAHFGQSPAEECATYVRFVNDKYVDYPKSGKPFCGKPIPGTSFPAA
ncbi:MAG TPA: ABC transporter substrate-binding protein [Acidimicrobiales bacterium]|jgi:branched-chain amino acid transport system substrate-binding protein